MEVQAVCLEDGFGALTQRLVRDLGGVAEVEGRFHIAGNHVGGSGAGAQVGDLEAGGREEGVATVPVLAHQSVQRRYDLVDGVAGQVRVATCLDTTNMQHAAERAATAVLDDVAQLLGGGGSPTMQ